MRRLTENDELFPSNDKSYSAVGTYLPKEKADLEAQWAAARQKNDAAGMKAAQDAAQSLRDRSLGHRQEFQKRNELLKALVESLEGMGFITGKPEFHKAAGNGSDHLGTILVRGRRGVQEISLVVPIGEDSQRGAQQAGTNPQSYNLKITGRPQS